MACKTWIAVHVLVVLLVLQIAALSCVTWPKPKSVTDYCKDSNDKNCKLLRAYQCAEVFGILTCIFFGLVLMAMQCGKAISDRLPIKVISLGLCIAGVLCSMLALIVLPSTYKSHFDGYFVNNNRTWFTLQFISTVFSLLATASTFFLGAEYEGNSVEAAKSSVNVIVLFLFTVLQTAALVVVSWPLASSVKDTCDANSGNDCKVQRSMIVSEVFGIVAAAVGGANMVLTFVSLATSTGVKILNLILSIVTSVFAIIAVIIWPGTYDDKIGSHPKFVDAASQNEQWLAFQIVATFLALFSCATAFLSGASNSTTSPPA